MEPVPLLPRWYDDAKLGIFVHWTAAAVPAFAPVTDSPFDLAAEGGWEEAMRCSPYIEWYQNSIAIEGSPAALHHAEVHGNRPYDDFVETFLDGHAGWQADPWADLFRPPALATWCSSPSTTTACCCGRATRPTRTSRGGGATATSSATWPPRCGRATCASAPTTRAASTGRFGGLPMRDFQAMLGAIPQTDEYVAYVDAHWHELIDRYRPDVLWNDIGSPGRGLDLPALFERYYAAVPDGVVNNRFDWMRPDRRRGALRLRDARVLHQGRARPGSGRAPAASARASATTARRTSRPTCRADALVRMFVDVVAHGGNLLLNVGPNADGTIPFVQAQRLLALGWWLRTNGDAIYGTRPWTRTDGTTGEGHDVRYTTRDGAVFAIVCGTPGRATVVELDVTPAAGADVHLLGHDAALPWEPTDAGCAVTLPIRPADAPAFALRLSEVPH